MSNIHGINFDNQTVTAKDHGHLFHCVIVDGIMSGCELSFSGTSLVITPGYLLVGGREMKLTAMSSEVDLRGMDTVEAICVLENYLDSAMRANLSSVRIIHGKGTGALRAAVQQALRKSKYVKKFRLGVYGEGEDGVTIAEFA
jgi:aspartate aminotransferase-like enzyme